MFFFYPNFFIRFIVSQMWGFLVRRTSQISASECWHKGSKLNLTVPLNRVGSWGIIPNLDLRSWTPILEMSTLSTTIFPPTGSTSLNKALIRVVFPLPVLPTIPILCPPSNVQLIPFRTNGDSRLYLICIYEHYDIKKLSFSELGSEKVCINQTCLQVRDFDSACDRPIDRWSSLFYYFRSLRC